MIDTDTCPVCHGIGEPAPLANGDVVFVHDDGENPSYCYSEADLPKLVPVRIGALSAVLEFVKDDPALDFADDHSSGRRVLAAIEELEERCEAARGG